MRYLHTIAEAINLAFADREAYVGDPKFVNVPTRGCSPPNTPPSSARASMPARHSGACPNPAFPTGSFSGQAVEGRGRRRARTRSIAAVADRYGNAYSATPSDTMYDTPMVEGLGFAPSARGAQSRLEPGHPLFVEPGKRPRLTPNPALALREGEFSMALGTPGGDVQCGRCCRCS